MVGIFDVSDDVYALNTLLSAFAHVYIRRSALRDTYPLQTSSAYPKVSQNKTTETQILETKL
jgi:hypothetical protein